MFQTRIPHFLNCTLKIVCFHKRYLKKYIEELHCCVEQSSNINTINFFFFFDKNKYNKLKQNYAASRIYASFITLPSRTSTLCIPLQLSVVLQIPFRPTHTS